MSHRRLPVSLRDKITKYYEHRFRGKLFDEERLLREVSRPLRTVRCDNSCLFPRGGGGTVIYGPYRYVPL